MRQLFDQATGACPGNTIAWRREDGRYVDALRPFVFKDGFTTPHDVHRARVEHLSAVRRVFCESSVFIFTLGLTEAWISPSDGTVFPAAPGVVCSSVRDDAAEFHNLTYGEILADLQTFVQAFRQLNPTARVILTVSPVPLTATYTDEHVLVATTHSKSILRAVCSELTATDDAVYYFPAYEIITGHHSGGQYYEDNLRTVSAHGVEHVMRVFDRTYLDEVTVNTCNANARRAPDEHDVICDEEEIVRTVKFSGKSLKALVVSNCATYAYVACLRTLFPEWTVWGAVAPVVKNWIENPADKAYGELVDYARTADAYIGFDPSFVWDEMPLPRHTRKVIIPPFLFRGLHPDTVELLQAPSVLDAGFTHSRIAVSRYLAGQTVRQTIDSFNSDVYQELGYPSVYGSEKSRVLDRFAAAGIDLSDAFDRWESRGNFLYTHNHPKLFVFFDILCQALPADLLTPDRYHKTRGMLDQVTDKGAESIIWPAYGGYEQRLGIEEPLVWRKGRGKNYQQLSLPSFIRQTFRRLDTVPALDAA